MECLDNIIGLSQTTCECLEEGRPSDYNVSKSGIFLDRLEGFNINLADGSSDCADGDIWARMAQAVEDAKLDYRTDLMGCVARTHKPRFNAFTGQLGQSSFKNTLNIAHSYFGMELCPRYLKGGFVTINKVGIIVNASVPVSFEIYSDNIDNGDEFPELIYSSTPINATADLITWASLTTPLELPMWSQAGGYIRYFVLLVNDGTFKPKDNKSSCGCGKDNAKAYSHWLSFKGVQGNDVTNFLTFQESNNLVLNGVALNVSLNCKVSEIICSDEYPLDFLNDGNAMNMAYAIRFKAGIKLFEDILSSDNINRFTLLNKEHCQEKITEWSTIYGKYIEDTCKNTDRLTENDCLVCRDSQGTILKRNIRA